MLMLVETFKVFKSYCYPYVFHRTAILMYSIILLSLCIPSYCYCLFLFSLMPLIVRTRKIVKSKFLQILRNFTEYIDFVQFLFLISSCNFTYSILLYLDFCVSHSLFSYCILWYCHQAYFYLIQFYLFLTYFIPFHLIQFHLILYYLIFFTVISFYLPKWQH